ncbi:MAG: permease-like cell division protein FtsX [Eubacterium sp.]|nr:permease-like cell division protein FtsX [Eubacterium sp.]
MTILSYNIRQAFQQLWRNRGTAVASIFAITAMLLILGLVFVVTVNLNLVTEMVKTDFDEIELFLMDDVSEGDAASMIEKIENMVGVSKAEYRTKEEAMDIMRARFGDKAYLLDSLGENPLPSSIIVTVSTLDDADGVYEKVSQLDGVEDVKYNQETVEKLTKASHYLQIASMVVMAFLVIVSIVVVSNIIKLTVFARQKEIEIMKYIGGTNWFIRGPFLVEGIIIGIISSVIAAGLTWFIYAKVTDLMGTQVITILGSPLVSASYLVANLFIIFMAIGISIGAAGSIISMRKFLD